MALILTVVLAGCSATGAGEDDASGAPQNTAPSSTAPATPEELRGPQSCEAITLENGATIPGDVFAACVVDYLAFAGSGASQMISPTGSSNMVWRMDERYEAYAELDSGTRMLAHGDSVWIDFGTGWVDANSNTPGMEAVSMVAKAWLQATAPELTRSMVSSSPTWVVGAEEEVALPDGSSQTLTSVSATAPFTWMGVSADAVTFWMNEPGKIILQEATATAVGHTATSTTHFTQWGGDVEIPTPPQ